MVNSPRDPLHTHTQTTHSVLHYTPTSDLDYGTVSCWARNAVNVQQSPCAFQIVAAGQFGGCGGRKVGQRLTGHGFN